MVFIFCLADRRYDIVKLLVDNKADIELKDERGYSAFHQAVEHGELQKYLRRIGLIYFLSTFRREIACLPAGVEFRACSLSYIPYCEKIDVIRLCLRSLSSFFYQLI